MFKTEEIEGGGRGGDNDLGGDALVEGYSLEADCLVVLEAGLHAGLDGVEREIDDVGDETGEGACEEVHSGGMALLDMVRHCWPQINLKLL